MKLSAICINLVLSVVLMSAVSVASESPFKGASKGHYRDATLFVDPAMAQIRGQLIWERFTELSADMYEYRKAMQRVSYTFVTGKRDGEPVDTVKVDMLLSPDSTMAWVTMGNEELPMIRIDYPECFPDENHKAGKEAQLQEIAESFATQATTTWVTLPYERFDIHIEENFYNNHSSQFNDFFNKFEPRYELIESLTNWNSEQVSGNKIQIYVEPSFTSCAYGYASAGNGVAYVYFWQNFTYQTQSEVCANPYYIDGNPYYDNPGELGDHWIYMKTTLHESIHLINPFPIFYRSWLTEGFAQYYGYNIFSMFNDINQETADYYIYNSIIPGYDWEDYVANDYHDTTSYNREIQESGGYDITAWMFSMLRDNHNLDWDNFYFIINNNLETLDTSQEIDGTPPLWDSIYTDIHIIDVFGKASGLSFEEIKTIFQYDGPDGPGWGVRQWVDLDWYADLVPELPHADPTLAPGELLPVTIHNYGGVSLVGVPVALYANSDLIWADTVEVADSSSLTLYIEHGLAMGTHALTLIVDENDLKIETDDTNNSDSMTLVIDCCQSPIRGNVDFDPGDVIDISDLVYLVDYMFTSGPEPACWSEANVDANGSDDSSGIDISDLVYLVDYMFSGGPEPVACP